MMSWSHTREDADLLDAEAWDTPVRLSDDDLHTHDGPGWRRAANRLDDPEDER